MRYGAAIALALLTLSSAAQAQGPDLAVRLGYPAGTRLIIVHADDIGVTHSVDAAATTAMATGLVNSGSIMIPCPWAPEAIAWARAHPGQDIGLHLTLTSERPGLRWGTVAPAAAVPSLVDRTGYMLHGWGPKAPPKPDDVEREIRTQIDRAYALGLRPTHLDSHQYRLQLVDSAIFAVFLRVGHQYHLPVLVVRDWFKSRPYLARAIGPNDVVIDHLVTLGSHTPSSQWEADYTHAIETLRPGVTEFIIHPGFDDDEMRAFSVNDPAWGSAWRQRDYAFFTSPQFRALLAREHVQLITWREIDERLAKEHSAVAHQGVPEAPRTAVREPAPEAPGRASRSATLRSSR